MLRCEGRLGAQGMVKGGNSEDTGSCRPGSGYSYSQCNEKQLKPRMRMTVALNKTPAGM